MRKGAIYVSGDKMLGFIGLELTSLPSYAYTPSLQYVYYFFVQSPGCNKDTKLTNVFISINLQVTVRQILHTMLALFSVEQSVKTPLLNIHPANQDSNNHVLLRF